jgi:hypothetical protein
MNKPGFVNGRGGLGLVFEQPTCRRQMKAGRNTLLALSPSQIDGCPILRVLGEGWDTQVSPLQSQTENTFVPFEIWILGHPLNIRSRWWWLKSAVLFAYGEQEYCADQRHKGNHEKYRGIR